MLTAVIPTYNREAILADTITHLMAQSPPPGEIVVVDQTVEHESETERQLREWHSAGAIVWLRQAEPSIARAMNAGLTAARHELVLFVDDDVAPEPGLIASHLAAHATHEAIIVAGRVIQPWHEGKDLSALTTFHFAQTRPAWIYEFMGGNFSLDRRLALELGGFDENFVRVAYRFEAEFAWRWVRSGRRIYFEPAACLHHLKAYGGGTRSFGHLLTTVRPHHAVGKYYYVLRTWRGWSSVGALIWSPIRAVITRHHLRHPWWIPLSFAAELAGIAWAGVLFARGPRYCGSRSERQRRGEVR